MKITKKTAEIRSIQITEFKQGIPVRSSAIIYHQCKFRYNHFYICRFRYVKHEVIEEVFEYDFTTKKCHLQCLIHMAKEVGLMPGGLE